jgi:hypothetical protein
MISNWIRNRTTATLLAVTTSLTLAAAGGARTVPAPPMPPNDEVPPLLTLEVSPASIAEGAVAQVTGALARPLGGDLFVELWFAGDAGPEDFEVEEARLFFAAGETKATLRIAARPDAVSEGNETLAVGSDDPAVRTAGKVGLEITDAPVRITPRRSLPGRNSASCLAEPSVRLEATSKGVTEGGSVERLTLRLSAPACDHLSFPIETDRISVPADLLFSAPSFEIPAGALASSVDVRALDDLEDEPLEQFVVRVAPLPGNDQDISVALLVEDNDADVTLAGPIGLSDVVAGRRAQFQLEVINPGFKDLVKVALLEAAVEGLTDVEWLCVGKGGAECPPKGEGFVQLTASMPAKSAIVVVVDALVDPSRRAALKHGASIAVLDVSVSDPDPSDNEVIASHGVDIVADLALDLEVEPWDPKAAKTELRYSMTVRNLGPSDAAGAQLESPLGAHLAWVGGDPDCVGTEASVKCGLGALGAGAKSKLEMVLAVASPYPAFTIQEAWLEASDPDPNPNNDESSLETKLDLFVPTLEEVVAIGKTTRESLASCSQLFESPGRLALRFSEELVGGGHPGDVDSVDSYRIYAPGPNGDFEISDCGTAESAIPGSDDVEIPLLAAAWNAESATVELTVKSSMLHAVGGVRRLIACESLRDSGENAIDGDGDGNPGGAAVRSFRIDAGNLVRNGHFDCNLDGWSALAPTPEDWTLGADASGSAYSASSRIDNSAAWPTVGLGVCVPTPGGSQLELRLRHRLSPLKGGSVDELGAATNVDAEVEVACTPYPSVGCAGAALVGEDDPALRYGAIPTTSAWTSVVRSIEAPKDTASLLCTVSATGEYVPFAFEVDEVRLRALVPDALQQQGTGIDGRQVALD